MSNPQTQIVYSDPQKAERRLRQLDLAMPTMTGCLQVGVSAAALTTLNHPTNWGGLSLWAEAIRWLRETLIQQGGWRRDDRNSLPTVVRGSGETGMAIAVVRGGAGTGDPKANPTTEYPRGTVTIARIERNGILPEFEHLAAEEDVAADDVPLWLLLHRREGDKLVAELSFPLEISKSGFVEKWGERIMITSIPLDPTRMPVLDEPPVTPDVTVRRRAS